MSWKEEFRAAVKDRQQLGKLLNLEIASLPNYPLFIPQRLIPILKRSSALRQQYIPSTEELSTQGLTDPIGDKVHLAAPQLIHRYKKRALFLPTQTCPIYCRFCFRKNELGQDPDLFSSQFEKTFDYLKKNKEIEEIIFSGGDPFVLDNSKIKLYLERFLDLDHIKYVRFHTKFLTTIPSRFDRELLEVLKFFSKRYKSVSLSFHINHLDEIDQEVDQTISSFPKELNLLVQTVLLKGVNNTVEDLKKLFQKCIDLELRPYYLHHPDIVTGAMHFGVSLEKGRELYAQLREELPGWALPHYIIDIPEGHGKTLAFNSETIEFSGKLINRLGQTIQLNSHLH
jgi:lysine 2,3-aminomutase